MRIDLFFINILNLPSPSHLLKRNEQNSLVIELPPNAWYDLHYRPRSQRLSYSLEEHHHKMAANRIRLQECKAEGGRIRTGFHRPHLHLWKDKGRRVWILHQFQRRVAHLVRLVLLEGVVLVLLEDVVLMKVELWKYRKVPMQQNINHVQHIFKTFSKNFCIF